MRSSGINNKNLKIKFDYLDVVDDVLVIYGSWSKKNAISDFYFLDDKNNKCAVEYLEKDTSQSNSFLIHVDMQKTKCLVPKVVVNEEVCNVKIEFGDASKLNNTFASLYLIGNKRIIKYNKLNNRFDIYKNNFINVFKSELKCTYFLIKKRQFRNLFYRVVTNIFNFFKSREIWLISDSYDLANDNGEQFFKYVINEKLNPDMKYFFVINKKSCDRKRLYYNYSNVIDINSFKYKFLYLTSSKIISSHIDESFVDPFGSNKKYLSDLLRFKFIYLQHRNATFDLVDKKFNIDMVSVKNEEELVKFEECFVREDIVKLTGLARNDYEDESVERQVLVLFGKENSDFFNRLINDKKVLNACERYNYKLRIISNDLDKSVNDDIYSIGNKDVIYNEEIANSLILVTDNISLAEDFIYLKRLSICKDCNEGKYDDFVRELINGMEKDGVLDKSYLDKLDKCFKFDDNGNCERIYGEIVNLN